MVGEGMFSDSRPEAAAQLQRMEMMGNSSQAMQQHARMNLIANSRHALQQKSAIDRINGLPLTLVQRQEDPVETQSESETPIQIEAQDSHEPNNTGLPDQLKSGIESLSGMAMDHVKVHYNSSQPAQLNALAYAQGSDIHVGPGQEQHLPHEAWHVVQQAQGRVKPTMQMKGEVAVNDDPSLEREADEMGSKALGGNIKTSQLSKMNIGRNLVLPITQMQWAPVPNGKSNFEFSCQYAFAFASSGDFITAIRMLAAMYPDAAEKYFELQPDPEDPEYENKRDAIENILYETFDSDDRLTIHQVIIKLMESPIIRGETDVHPEPEEPAVDEIEELRLKFAELSIHEKFHSDADGGAEEHEIYQEDGIVIVKSNPTPLATIIATGNWEGYPIAHPVLAKLNALQATAQTALYKIAGKKPLGITGARTKANMDAFRLVLKKIAGILGDLGGATNKATLMKATVLTGDNVGVDAAPIEGKLVRARPLSILSAASGSKPHDGRLMKAIRTAAGPQSKSYVQMHLLNDLVFGPGQLWNLTPGPKQSNSTMESVIEDPLKRAILDKGLMINFEAEVTYNKDPMAATQKQIDQDPNDYRFTSIKFKAEQLEYDATVPGWVPAAVQDPDVKAIHNKKVNWDYGGLTPLVAKPRILDAATTVADLVAANIQPAAAARIFAYVQANPGATFGGAGKQKKLANAVKAWDGQKNIPNISSWKATAVLWT